MAALPNLGARAVVKAFGRDGWHVARQKGSHVILVKEESWVTLSVPDHREVAPGTLRSLIRASGLTVEAFAALAKKNCSPSSSVRA
jgi:predicted RNA binding protein YcfA (HicA-like mRNA interferase family)